MEVNMLHVMKLAVGVRDIAHLLELQAERARLLPPLRHRTRSFPRRAAEIIDGGSMYWVVAGAMVVRQRVLDIIEDTRDDGRNCAAFLLDPKLVPVAARLLKPFQGWRYLQPADAPADLTAARRARGTAALPPDLQRALRELCLI
jgi:hypothetical protein